MTMNLLVHGGAGRTSTEPTIRQQTLDSAVEVGLEADTPIAAVEAAINVLEAAPRFNAGVGGAVQADGVVRTDAGLMTSDRAVGAACSMAGVERAVSVARAVLERTPHVCLAGQQATAFADASGIDTEASLLTADTRERFAAAAPPGFGDGDAGVDGETNLDTQLTWVKDHFGGMDTVGAVASDGTQLAAATSTGGRWFSLPGRVGDVSQVGSGFYCTPVGAVSATGAGEDIARVTLSRTVLDHLEQGVPPALAANRAIEDFERLTGSTAGVIVCAADGTLGHAHNAEEMQVGAGTETG